MRELCSDLEIHLFETSGHWMQQEEASGVSARLLAWLERCEG